MFVIYCPSPTPRRSAAYRFYSHQKGSSISCHYIWPTNPQGSDYELSLIVKWQEGFSEMRTSSAAIGNASSMLGMEKLGRARLGQDRGPWDEFSQSIIGVSAVKGDVMISVEGGPMPQDVQRAFVEKAIVNLGK
jgi:hypothetical protein